MTRPLVVELVGPPGAGKSAVARLLAARDPGVRAGLGVDAVPRRLLAAGAVDVLGTLAGLARDRRGPPPWPESRQAIRLAALHRFVGNGGGAGARLLLLEDGPVLVLSWLAVFRPASASQPAFRAWRARAVRDWAATLGAVVYLDAADAVLAERIRGRAKPHPVKAADDRAIADFVGAFRAAFQRVIPEVTPGPAARRLTCRTDEGPLEAVAAAILAGLA